MNICQKFLDLSPERRFSVVKRYSLCINCFTGGHRLNECKSTFGCSVCKLKHHNLLHREVSGSSSGVLDAPGSSGAVRSNDEVQNCFAATSRQILLGTVVVGIYHRGETFRARPLIDSRSQATFISKGLQRKLGLPTVNIHARVTGLNGSCAGAVKRQCSFVLTSLLDD